MPATSSAFLNVTDIQRSLAFYRALGFRVLKEWKDKESGETTYADLSFQGADFGLGNIGWNDEPSFRAWVSTPLGAGVVVYFTVSNVDKVHDAAKAAGATIEVPLQDRSYGRVFTLNDPDGYTITFVQEPRKRPAKKAAKARKARPTARSRRSAAGRRK